MILFCTAVGTAIAWCGGRCAMPDGRCLNILLFWRRSTAALVFRVGACFEVSLFCPPFPLVPWTLSSKNQAAPSYLCDFLQLYTPSRILRSASDSLSLQIPRTRLSTVGSRTCSVFSSSTWNDLPLLLQQNPSLDPSKCNLKIILFPKL